MRVCPACDCHVLLLDPRCPHCEAPLPGTGSRALRVGASVGLGLTLAACLGRAEAAYGVPATMSDDFGPTTNGTDTDTEGEGECELPDDATPSGETALITIRNERDAAIFVTPYSSFTCNYGKVEIDVGGEPVLWDHAGTYAFACSSDLCGWSCSDGGAAGFIINPGAEAQVEWNGALWTETALPEACEAEYDDCVNPPGDTCEVRTLVEGDYTVRVNLSETCPVEDECMACTDGVCEVFFYEPSMGEISESFEVSATFPAGAEVTIE
ncbi:hypothetical protein ENSA5_67180 [Enhygromyxa salina]|uniref:Uncharacterized protein n=1 Tax=Enhygromyxa salina TaxID=215803 RepID=A0A2S9XBH3_9BACT|nr:hypothetical protein [Enhygromyxa salina]PRP90196.1 hypothetical protein ENSA5_67180 [Enhygromyxa salina]